MSDPFRSARIIPRRKAAELADVSVDTWDRLEAKGQTPPKVQISERRFGYRLIDFERWLDARRTRPVNEA